MALKAMRAKAQKESKEKALRITIKTLPIPEHNFYASTMRIIQHKQTAQIIFGQFVPGSSAYLSKVLSVHMTLTRLTMLRMSFDEPFMKSIIATSAVSDDLIPFPEISIKDPLPTIIEQCAHLIRIIINTDAESALDFYLLPISHAKPTMSQFVPKARVYCQASITKQLVSFVQQLNGNRKI